MHEGHLMTQVVKMVEDRLREIPGSRPTVIRLKVSPLSHLHQHDTRSIGQAFSLAASGTRVEGAALEIIRTALPLRCEGCGKTSEVDGCDPACPCCGCRAVAIEDFPEVVLHEIDVE